MKIAVTATGPNLDSQVEARFGRCAYFLIIDPDTMEFESLRNPNTALGGGAGVQSAQLMAEKDVKVVLTGNCGPNAFRTFGAAGIQVIVGVSGAVRAAAEQFKSGSLASASGPNVASHFGTGGGAGQGMGGGRGMGQGMGRGMGMGAVVAGGSPVSPTGPARALGKEDELALLKQQADEAAQQMRQIQERIDQLEKGG